MIPFRQGPHFLVKLILFIIIDVKGSDFSPGPFAVTNERIAVFDYSRQLTRDYASILSVINSDSTKRNDLYYILTVDKLVWIFTVIIIIQISIIASISYDFQFKNLIQNLFSTIEALIHGSIYYIMCYPKRFNYNLIFY